MENSSRVRCSSRTHTISTTKPTKIKTSRGIGYLNAGAPVQTSEPPLTMMNSAKLLAPRVTRRGKWPYTDGTYKGYPF